MNLAMLNKVLTSLSESPIHFETREEADMLKKVDLS